MKSTRAFTLVLVTAPDRKVARRLARLALEARLIACANLVPGIESHYWWKGKLERGSEILIVFKTRTSALSKVEQLVLKHHPYDTPEIISVPITSSTPRYLAWLANSLTH